MSYFVLFAKQSWLCSYRQWHFFVSFYVECVWFLRRFWYWWTPYVVLLFEYYFCSNSQISGMYISEQGRSIFYVPGATRLWCLYVTFHLCVCAVSLCRLFRELTNVYDSQYYNVCSRLLGNNFSEFGKYWNLACIFPCVFISYF